MKPKKKRKVNYKKKLWNIFSKVIRLKDADSDGYVKCFTCSVKRPWKDMDAGHFIPKSLGMSIYFEETNVHPQCGGCNRFKHGNLSEYALNLQNKYGPNILDELNKKRHAILQLRDVDYEELIEKYQTKLDALMPDGL